MDLVNTFVKAIEYIEDHLLDEINIQDISDNVYMAPHYFQKCFTIYAGISPSDYIKSRRLYLAALELRNSNISITDVAIKYSYSSSDAFTKAFMRFHGITPKEARDIHIPIKTYLPLKIKIIIEGGDKMDFIIEEHENLKFIGVEKEIPCDKGYLECPKFWDEFFTKYYGSSDEDVKSCIKENSIAEFALCYGDNGKTFKYMIGGLYKGGDVPPEFKVIEFPSSKWAKFKCIGPISKVFQQLNTQVWKEWLPNNPKYDLAFDADIEWYSNGNTESDDYVSGIWLPVKEK